MNLTYFRPKIKRECGKQKQQPSQQKICRQNIRHQKFIWEHHIWCSCGHRLIWWGVRYRFAKNPMLHRTILCKSITFAYVHLWGNKSKRGLEAWVIKMVKL